jgi:pimeloyl-ACP methyl ester carboxylesterase
MEMEGMAAMSTYVLIHGAQHGGWCWRKVVPLLEAEGHTVVAPDLPGHGDDRTPPARVTLASYAERICAVAGAQKEPVILVGHSLGGMAITSAAEDCPEQIHSLVYLCAFLPRNGESASILARQDPQSKLNPNFVRVADGAVAVRNEVIHEALYANCSAEDEAFAMSRLTPQATAPLKAPVMTSAERWGSIPRYYIECTGDRAITLELQRKMQENSPCRQVFSIGTDHSPFLSTPAALVEIVTRIGDGRAPA